jgi:leader peptidase (prepilin peptidase)/N-methyltransferase
VLLLIAQTALHPSPEWALGAVGASLFLLVAALAYPQGLGMGDVKLALLLGAVLGRNVSVGLMMGFIAALVPSAFLFAAHGRKARKMAIPLVPFLALGAVIALFFGGVLLDRYLALTGG